VKRVTVAITVSDDYYSHKLRKVRSAMINAAVLKATEEDLEVAAIDAKVGHIRKQP
jgi:hypothetical protein